jgi:DNA-binding response OmpR family regulator
MAKYRIMIIDDDDDARRMLAMALRARFEVVEASDGLDALSKLEIFEPDFAIIDIMMPLMDGYQVCEAIRRNPRFGATQVLFLSAYGSKEHIKKSYAVGGNLFMTKPVDPERVLKNLDFTVKHEPPPLRPKTYTIEQLMAMDSAPKHSAPLPAAPLSAAPHPAAPPSPPPAAPEAQAAVHPPPAEAKTGKEQTPRILAIDDDTEMLKMLELALRDEFEVTTATNGLEAIECIVEHNPDLLLLDIMMPKMNGYQLLQSVRRNAYYKALPVIVLSAKSSPKDREYAARLGATNFIAKPYHVDELFAMIHSITQAPGFKVSAKKYTLYEIRERHYSEDKIRAERRKEIDRKRKYQAMQDVIDEGKNE